MGSERVANLGMETRWFLGRGDQIGCDISLPQNRVELSRLRMTHPLADATDYTDMMELDPLFGWARTGRIRVHSG